MPSARPGALALAGLLWMPLPAAAQTAPSLGSSASFALLGGTAVTDSGTSIVTGNVGVSPGHTISGFADGAVQIGAIYVDDALARQAQKDNAAAYNDLAGHACTPISGTTLGPGVYCLTSPLTGALTLDAADDPHAVWIFQGASLATTANTVVRVINSGYEGNVFWQVSGSATLGAGTAFIGSILTLSDITFGDGASLSGRALSQSGAVRLNHDKVSLCCDPNDPVVLTQSVLDDGSVGKMYSAIFTASGGTPPYTYAFSGDIPPGLAPSRNTLSGTPNQPGKYCFLVTATDSRGCQATRDYCITIAPCGIVIDPPDLPKTCSIDQKITAGGGTPPYTLSATGLPAGVTFDPSSGTLSGEPVTPGCYTIIVTAKDAFCTVSRTYTISRIAIAPETLPNGMEATPYPATPITASGCTPPYTFHFSGALPPGLSPLPTGFTINGTPTAVGCFTFTVTVTDALGFICSKTYTICIDPCPIVVQPDSLAKACAGVPYSQTITAACGTPPYTFTSPAIPLGLTFAGGVLSGVTQSAGCIDFIVTVTDSRGLTATKHYNFCSAKVIVKPDTLPDAQAGVPYSQTIVASGGDGSYTYTATGLPACGLTLDPSSGVISGTPTAGCSAFLTVTATDKNGCTGNQTYQIDVGCSSIAISPATLPGGIESSPYSQSITATGGVPPYTFTLVSGTIPPGLDLAPDGTLSGIPSSIAFPTLFGTYCFDVAASDAAGCIGTISYTIVISEATCPSGTVIVLSPSSLPQAATGTPYNQFISASGGTPPYTFLITSGALPPGLTLNSATGLVSGTPTASGNYTLTIGALDANGCFGSIGCTVVMTVDIPATTEWGMWMLASMLAIVGIAAMRIRG